MSYARSGQLPAFGSEDYRRTMEVALAVKSGRRTPASPPPAKGLVIEQAEFCPTPNPFNGANCRRARCPHCGVPWVRSWQTVSRVALEHSGRAVVLITITAPGEDFLPWSCSLPHKHSGARGCKVKADYADLWSSDQTERLTKLRDAARIAVKRAGLPVDRLWLERVWEPQKRGVGHVHVIAGADTPEQLAAAEMFHRELRRIAPDHLFGTKLDMTRPMSGEEAARYLASYLLGRSRKKGGKATLRDNLGDPRMPRSLIYVARKLTRETCVTMRRMRVVRWYFACRSCRLSHYPRLFGEELIAVAKACVLIERSNAPPDLAFATHVSALRLMRRLAAPA